ncbi:MAG: hypothetical protein WC716_03625 [Chitinophagaceae bacterium]|jgi:hypothetical protein
MTFLHKRYRKMLLLIVALLYLAVLLIYLALMGFGRFLYNSRGCEQFYIDNTELHTRTDIPAKLEIDCHYNSKILLKRVYFVIDKKEVKMPGHIVFSEFKPLPSVSGFKTNDFFRFNGDTLGKLHTSALFYKEHTKQNGEYYKALLDTVSGQVWLNLRYAE